jgi:hypothetical protein
VSLEHFSGARFAAPGQQSKGNTMAATRLRIGDRIRLTKRHLTYPAGTEGTITHLYRFNAAAYRARFDGQADDEIVYYDVFTDLSLEPKGPHSAPLGG